MSLAFFLYLLRSTNADGSQRVCDERSLRNAIAKGGEIVFSCDASIQLRAPLAITQPVSIDAGGKSVTLDGANRTRIFVVANGGDLFLHGLVLKNGIDQGVNLATNELINARGGAIFSIGGRVVAKQCQFEANHAFGGKGRIYCYDCADGLPSLPGGSAEGGAIWSQGSHVEMVSCHFYQNSATGGEGGGSYLNITPAAEGGTSRGGAVSCHGGQVVLKNCIFQSNHALGGQGGYNAGGFYHDRFGAGFGGAVSLENVAAHMEGCRLEGNQGQGGGGALFNDLGALQISDTFVISNLCVGSVSDNKFALTVPVAGGGIYNSGDLEISRCQFAGNRVLGERTQRGNGGDALGGGLFSSGTTRMANTLLLGNSVQSGSGGGFGFPVVDGAGLGGGFYNSSALTMVNCAVVSNWAAGVFVGSTISAPAGIGAGGGIHNRGSGNITNTTIAYNLSQGGLSDVIAYAGGDAFGGGIHNESGTLALSHVTIAYNSTLVPSRTNHPPVAKGGGIFVKAGEVVLFHSILASNVGGGNAEGRIHEAGKNMSSDASPPLAEGSNGVNPLLGGLVNVEGGTLAFPLLPASPAIDGGSSLGCPPVDQRGLIRPQGASCDLGALEMRDALSSLSIARMDSTHLQLKLQGDSSTSYVIESSENLRDWTAGPPVTTGSSGVSIVVTTIGPSAPATIYYRARTQ